MSAGVSQESCEHMMGTSHNDMFLVISDRNWTHLGQPVEEGVSTEMGERTGADLEEILWSWS